MSEGWPDERGDFVAAESLSRVEQPTALERAENPPTNSTARANMEYAPFGMTEWAYALAADVMALEARLRVAEEALQEIAENREARLLNMDGKEIEPWRDKRGRMRGSPRLQALAALGSVGVGEEA